MTVRYIPVHLPELTDPPIFNAAAVARYVEPPQLSARR